MRNLLTALNGEDRLILSSMAVAFGGAGLGAWLGEPRIFGLTALVVISMLLIGWHVTQSARLSWLLIFGLVAGVLELWVDWVHVTYFRSLVYTDYFGFQIMASPFYMPIGWCLTVVQFGYLTLRLSDRWPHWVAVGTITVLGISLPPWYEEFAAPARAWHYTTGGLMLSNTPVWVIFAYGSGTCAIATLVLLLYQPRAWGLAVLGGVFTGASLMFAGVFWFAWIGR